MVFGRSGPRTQEDLDMTLSLLRAERFTAFASLRVELSPGVNVFIGENGTGKTHLLKLGYVACEITRSGLSFPEKLVRVFMPDGGRLGRLVHRVQGSTRALVEVGRQDVEMGLRCSFSNHADTPKSKGVRTTGVKDWSARPVEAAYIPVKEMLANAPGFRALYELREVAFEEVYRDILDRAFRPILKGRHDRRRARLLRALSESMEGRVVTKGERFFLRNVRGELEFSLVAEGIRKLALLWLLIQNGTLLEGAVLFWDEPEANLNPRALGVVVDILLELQRWGVQILLATHDYVLLKEFQLRAGRRDEVRYHALYRDPSGKIQCASTKDYYSIEPNAILDTFGDLWNRELERAGR